MKLAIFLLYQEDAFDKESLNQVKRWRVSLFKIAKDNKELPINEDKEEKDGLDALKMLNKQVDLADTNQKILSKSTLKVLSLNYSSKELESVILETTKKIEKSVSREHLEHRKLMIMLLIFISVCFAILCDKIYVRIR